tara:strand:- start:3567 stop:3863 length:297 start_codon:yes stop_codon:yes gene_type:complete
MVAGFILLIISWVALALLYYKYRQLQQTPNIQLTQLRHDLATPLATIKLGVAHLQKCTPNLLNGDAAQCCSKLQLQQLPQIMDNTSKAVTQAQEMLKL